MPRVPQYQSNIQTNAAPNAMQTGLQVNAPADAFGIDLRGVMAVVEKEREAADEARVNEQYTLLSKAANESLYGDAGVLRLEGKQAIGAADKWASDFDKIAGELSKQLTPAQQAKFARLSEQTKRGFYAGALRHEGHQSMKWQDEAHKAVIGQMLDTVGNAWNDGLMIETNISEALRAQSKRPEYLGASAEVRRQMDERLTGAFHARVVQSALNAGDTQYANSYFERVKDQIPLEMRDKVAERIKPANDFAAGKALALEAITELQAGRSITEVERMVMEKAGGKEIHAVAQSLLREHQDAERREASRVSGSFIEKFEQAPSRRSYNAIISSPEFQAMPPEARANLVKYFRSELEQADRRGQERFDSPEHFAELLRVMEDPGLSQMSRTEILALTPKLGKANVNRLLGEHGRINSEVGKFKIPVALVNDAMPKALLENSAGAREKAHAFRGAVAVALMDWKAKNPGRIPTDEEQMEIARAGNAEYVRIGRFWNSDAKAFEAKPGDVPKSFFDAMKARGATDEEIAAAWAIKSGAAK